MRSARRGTACAVLLALLLPVFLSLLPLSAISPAAALERDIALSVCAGLGERQDHDRQADGGHDHCILCGSHCLNAGPGLSAHSPAFSLAAPASGVDAPPGAPDGVPPPLKALLDASPPRGPPAPLLA